MGTSCIIQVPNVLDKFPIYSTSSKCILQVPNVLDKSPMYWTCPQCIGQVLNVLDKSPMYWTCPQCIGQVPNVLDKSSMYWTSFKYILKFQNAFYNFQVYSMRSPCTSQGLEYSMNSEYTLRAQGRYVIFYNLTNVYPLCEVVH